MNSCPKQKQHPAAMQVNDCFLDGDGKQFVVQLLK